MSCDTNRKRLWKILKLNSLEMENIYLTAKDRAQEIPPTQTERELWIDKTERLFTFFDYQELARPVHSKTGLPRLSSLAGYAALWDELENRQALTIEPPTGINKDDLTKLLTKLGELAVQHQTKIELAILGGAAMVLGYSSRTATLDIDAVFIAPTDKVEIRKLIHETAEEFNLSDDWLNDAAQGFLNAVSIGKSVFSAPGIDVNLLIPEQLLASKLGSWRGRKDRLDAYRLMKEFKGLTKEQLWSSIEPYIIPHQELRTQLAFSQLWERFDDNES